MSDEIRADEQARREQFHDVAQRVVEGSGRRLEPRSRPQMMSVRFDPALVRALRQIARETGLTVSELIRQGAEEIVNDYASKTVRVRFDLLEAHRIETRLDEGNQRTGTSASRYGVRGEPATATG
jgi:hypothetical protein